MINRFWLKFLEFHKGCTVSEIAISIGLGIVLFFAIVGLLLLIIYKI